MKHRCGILMVISGPSGSGKGTIAKELMVDTGFALSVSVTTRKPRRGEEDGVHYFFKTDEQFDEMLENNEFLEWADYLGSRYGTPRAYVDKMLKEGVNVILEIEERGALQVKEVFPECVLIFIIPPTLSELKRRLLTRGTEDLSVIAQRHEKAKEELDFIDYYDYIVINDTIFKAVSEILSIAKVEPLRVFRNTEIVNRLKGEIINA